jgi:PAS domain S-box-containing protein
VHGQGLPETVLVVDDSGTSRRLFRRLLEDAGMGVTTVASGRQCLAMLEAGARFDCVLLDLVLADIHGYEVLDFIRASDPDSTVVVMTARGDALGPTEALYRGADGYVTKREMYRSSWESLSPILLYAHERRTALRREAALRRELEQRDELLLAVLEHVPEGVFVAEAPNGRIRYLSTYARELLGRGSGRVPDGCDLRAGEQWTILNRDGEGRPDEMPLVRAVTRGEKVVDEEYVLRRADGTRIPILVSAGPIRDPSGRVMAAIGVWRDIRRIRRFQRELERKVDERTAELHGANRELQRLHNLRSVFLANVSHELRTPLNCIVGFTELLREGRSGPLTEAQATQLRLMAEASDRLLHLVDNLIELTRLESAESALDEVEFAPADLLSAILDRFLPRAIERQVTLEGRGPKQGVRVVGPFALVEQLLGQLVDNALKFTERGRVEVEVGLEAERLMIHVLDSGKGIESEALERLFEPFSGSGGIGLHLCKTIVDRVGGSIHAESVINGGTVVTVSVPVRGF